MIYLNQAATTYPKPQCVLDAHTASLYRAPEGQFRSGQCGTGETVFEQCRKNLGKLLGIRAYERIFFSSGATDSSNALICGMELAGKRVMTTQAEHNSILRPLMNQKAYVGSVTVVPCGKWGRIDPEELEASITEDTAAVFVNHCSNVTGMIQDLSAIGEVCRKKGVLFVVDASQSAGCILIDVDGWGIDALIFTGHKGLFGVQGTGGYFVRPGVPLKPYRYGGTGRNSRQILYTGEGDYEYEAGTQNGPGIAALNAGVCYVLDRSVEAIAQKERVLMELLYRELGRMKDVILYGSEETNRGPVLSFNLKTLSPSDTAYILQNSYDIVVRTGLQCAPLIHQALGTEKEGTVRVSISDLTEEADIRAFLSAVKDIVRSTGGEL